MDALFVEVRLDFGAARNVLRQPPGSGCLEKLASRLTGMRETCIFAAPIGKPLRGAGWLKIVTPTLQDVSRAYRLFLGL